MLWRFLTLFGAGLLTWPLTAPPGQPPKAWRPPLALGAGPPRPVTDAGSAARVALEDLETRSRREQPYLRYFTLWDVPADERDRYRRLLNWLCASLTMRGIFKPLEAVTGTGGALLVLDLRHYDWDPKVFDTLALKSTYFLAQRIRVTQEVKTIVTYKPRYKQIYRRYTYPGGQVRGVWEQQLQPGRDREVKEVKGAPVEEVVLTVQDTVGAATGQRLIQLSQSPFPLVLAGEFVAGATVPPFYYDILRIGKTEAEFQKLIDGDRGVSKRLETDRRSNITWSGVTRFNRRLDRVPTRVNVRGGAYWYSTDVNTDVKEKNYHNILLDRKEKNFDGSEQIAHNALGLQVYFTCNNKGARVDSVPTAIAGDSSSTSNFPDVVNGISCMRCHDVGTLPFTSVYKKLRKSIQVFGYKEEDLERLDQLYNDDLAEVVETDQQIFRKACLKISGLEPPVIVAELKKRYREWQDARIDQARMAADLGLSKEAMLPILRRSQNPTILLAVGDDPEPISRTQWQEAFPEAAQLVLAATRKERGR